MILNILNQSFPETEPVSSKILQIQWMWGSGLLHRQQIKHKSTQSRIEILSRACPAALSSAQECSLSSEQCIPMIPPSTDTPTASHTSLHSPESGTPAAEQLQHSPPLCSTRTYRQSSDYGHPLNYRPRITRGDRRWVQNADELGDVSAPMNASVLVCHPAPFVGWGKDDTI